MDIFNGVLSRIILKIDTKSENGRRGYLTQPVDAGAGEGGDPGEGEDGQTVEDGPDIGQQIHAHSELE